MVFLAADCVAAEWGAAFWLLAVCDVVVGGTAFLATGWAGWVEPADECATGFGALFAAVFSWAYKPLAARQTAVNRINSSLLVL